VPIPVVDTSLQKLLESGNFNLADADALGLLLHGGSVIDWKRLNMASLEEVDAFLELHGHSWADPFDRRRLLGLYLDAVEYLAENYDYRLPPGLAAVDDVRTVFLDASGRSGGGDAQLLSCMILKVMHIIHHAQARELLFLSPVAARRMFSVAEQKVGREVVAMQKAGFPINHFSGGRKTLHNQVTRLLADRETIAARVFDKASFLIVTEGRGDIVPVLWHLTRKVFPFNYAVPGTTCNSLIDFVSQLQAIPRFAKSLDMLQFPAAGDLCGQRASVSPRPNAVDFIVDMPVRLDELGVAVSQETQERLGRIVFTLVEFQVQDLASFRAGESGDKNLPAQRRRLKQKAWERLTGGKV
jgi:uncharacterized protein (TIGR04552 family)